MSYDERVRMAHIVEFLKIAILNSNIHFAAIEPLAKILNELSEMAYPETKAA
jgi:hypothetical protein